MAESSQIRDLRLAKFLAGFASCQLELANNAMAFSKHLLGPVAHSEPLAAQQHHQSRWCDGEIDEGDVPDLEDGDDEHEHDQHHAEALDGLILDDCPALAQIVAHCEEIPDALIEEAIAELDFASPAALADAAELISGWRDELSRLHILLHTQPDW